MKIQGGKYRSLTKFTTKSPVPNKKECLWRELNVMTMTRIPQIQTHF